VKGNLTIVERNRGLLSPRDGFQVYEKLAGWGRDNLFAGNLADVQGPGYAFKIAGGAGNVVACDNVSQGAKKGLANVPCRAPGSGLRAPGSGGLGARSP
jgi:hypothetical protein